jgi:hypothetical protein
MHGRAPTERAHLVGDLPGGGDAAHRRVAVVLRGAGDAIDLGDRHVGSRLRQRQRDPAADARAHRR